MSAAPEFRVEPPEPEVAAQHVHHVADPLGHAPREPAGVEHAQNVADGMDRRVREPSGPR